MPNVVPAGQDAMEVLHKVHTGQLLDEHELAMLKRMRMRQDAAGGEAPPVPIGLNLATELRRDAMEILGLKEDDVLALIRRQPRGRVSSTSESVRVGRLGGWRNS